PLPDRGPPRRARRRAAGGERRRVAPGARVPESTFRPAVRPRARRQPGRRRPRDSLGGAEAVTKLFELRELQDRASVRFSLPPVRGRFGPLALEGFAYRAWDGSVRGWVNLCPHRAQPLDLGDARLFNSLGEIACQAHAPRFDPETGACIAGPC